MRKIVVAGLIFICFILQCSVFPVFAFAGIIPNLMIILTSSFGFMRGEKEGLLIGFFCGLLQDVFFGEMIGPYALVLMYIGYMNGKFLRIFFPDDIKFPIALVIGSDFCYGLCCYLILFLLRGRLSFLFYCTKVILPEGLYTIVVAMFLYPLLWKVNNLLEVREKRSAQKFV